MKDIIETYLSQSKNIYDKRIIEIIEQSLYCDENDYNVQLLMNECIQDCINKLGTSNDNILYYLKNRIHMYFAERCKIMNELVNKRMHINNQMLKLKNMVLPEQRSPEWYSIRENLLTASSLADALGKGRFTTRDHLLLDKTSNTSKPFEMNPIIEWGVKYEPVATEFYEKMNNLKIVEFGLIPHPELSIFGASPDGICDIDSPKEYVGRMLEIKCPPKRQFTNEVPIHYWMQMQGQLEVCDLERV